MFFYFKYLSIYLYIYLSIYKQTIIIQAVNKGKIYLYIWSPPSEQYLNISHTPMFYISISPEEFIYKWGTRYHPIIKGDSEDMLCCCSCNTDVYVRIAWSLSAASVSMTCAWKIAAFLHKQLERLQALAELHGGCGCSHCSCYHRPRAYSCVHSCMLQTAQMIATL